ncbi:MAG: ribosome recycling factor [Puniceicoccales bacterium]|jgi:ribosome recycling factor|nr:ribosome recycling factor [Puniceicoccales bacterium]
MKTDELLEEFRIKMEKSIQHMIAELHSLHTGKSSSSMVDNIIVDFYGKNMRIKDLAAIIIPDHKTIQINPWDRNSVQPIIKAILSSNVGLTPVAQGPLIRCIVPEISGERRQELVKIARNMAEEARVGVRSVRRDSLELFKNSKKNGIISEDEFKRFEKEIQKLTDGIIEQIAKLLEIKEKDLITP